MISQRPQVLIDASPLRYLKTGLGQFTYWILNAMATAKDAPSIAAIAHSSSRALIPSSIPLIAANWLRRHGPAWLQSMLYPGHTVWHMTTENTRLTGVPRTAKLLLTIHGLHFLDEESAEKAGVELNKVQQLVDRADYITTVSAFTAARVRSVLRTNEKPVEVVYNGITQPTSAEAPAWAPDKKFFFSVGTFFPRKNFHLLLPVMKYFPDHMLIVAGDCDRPYGNWIRQEILRLGLEDQVKLPGEISDAVRQWCLQHTEAFLFPSSSEGFGIPLLEAFAAGAPVFSSKAGSLPEIGGAHAWYWDELTPEAMATAINAGLSVDDENRRTARKSYAAQFTWRAAAEHYLRIYKQLLRG